MAIDRIVSFKLKKAIIYVDIFSLLVITFVTILGYFIPYIITIISIAVHELSHIAIASFFKANVLCVRVLPVGFNAVIDDGNCDRYGRALIYISGPLINLVIAAILHTLNILLFASNILSLLVAINIWLAIFNMLPILPLDGGRFAMELLAGHLGLFKTKKYLAIISYFFSIVIIIFGVVVFRNTMYNFTLILIGIYILSNLKTCVKEIASMNVRNFVYRRSRIFRKGIYNSRQIVVMKSTKLSEAIRAMDYADLFHIISILDEDLKIVCVVTEQQVLDVIMESDTDITFETFLTK